MAHHATFRAFAEPGFGPKWAAHTRDRWPGYAGVEADDDTAAAVAVLERAMPELMHIAFPLIVRYLLETCDTVAQAVDALKALPVPTAQNLTLLGVDGAVSVHVGPDRDLAVADGLPVTNHQEEPPPPAQEEFSATVARRCTLAHLAAARAGVEDVAAAMFTPPLYSTRWPGAASWEQSFAAFDEGERAVSY